MKNVIKNILLLTTLLSWSLAATIGHIDVPRVFTSYKETEKVETSVREMIRKFEKEANEYQQKIANARIDGKEQSDILKIQQEMEKELGPKEKEINNYKEEQMARIRKDIITSTEIIAKNLGIDVVVDKQAVIAGGIDITDQVIRNLNR